MKCKIVGKKKPFYDGKLRKVGDEITIPDDVMKSKNKPKWAEPVKVEADLGKSK